MKQSETRAKIKNFVLRHRSAFYGGLVLLVLLVLIYFLAGAPNKKVIQAQDEIFRLAENIRQEYKKRPDYWGLSTQSVLQSKIAPASMLKSGKLFSTIAKEVFVGADENGSVIMPGTRSFYIVYKGLSKKNCVDMASYPMSEQSKLGLLSVTIVNEQNEIVFQWGGEYSLPIDKKDAARICRQKNTILWNFE